MKLKSPRNKGKRHEYHVRDLLRGFGFEAQRTPMSGAISFMKGDVIAKDWPFFIECKNTQKTQFAEWYHKAETECGAKPPIIIWTRNRDDIFCFLRFSDLLMHMTGKPIQPIRKPEKPKHLGLEETASLKFSKKHQIRRSAKL